MKFKLIKPALQPKKVLGVYHTVDNSFTLKGRDKHDYYINEEGIMISCSNVRDKVMMYSEKDVLLYEGDKIIITL